MIFYSKTLHLAELPDFLRQPRQAMQRNVVEPNAWVALKLPSDGVRVLQVVPHT